MTTYNNKLYNIIIYTSGTCFDRKSENTQSFPGMCFIIKLKLCKAKLHLCRRGEDVSDDLKIVRGAWSVSRTNLAPIRYFLNLFIPHTTTAKPSRSGMDHLASELESFCSKTSLERVHHRVPGECMRLSLYPTHLFG